MGKEKKEREKLERKRSKSPSKKKKKKKKKTKSLKKKKEDTTDTVEGKEYPCTQCDRTFTSVHGRAGHMQIHVRERMEREKAEGNDMLVDDDEDYTDEEEEQGNSGENKPYWD